MLHRIMSMVSSASARILPLILGIQIALMPMAQAQNSCDADGSKGLFAQFERVIEQVGGARGWSFRDNAFRPLTLKEFEARGAKHFYVGTPEGRDLFVQVKVDEATIKMDVFERIGGNYLEVSSSAFKTDESSVKVFQAIEKEAKRLKVASWKSESDASMITFFVLLFASLVAVYAMDGDLMTKALALGSSQVLCLIGVHIAGAISGKLSHRIPALKDLQLED